MKTWSGAVYRQGEEITCRIGEGYSLERYVEWGSVTKVITAQAILKLADEEAISLDQPADDIVHWGLPRTITIGALLDHKSGLPRNHAGIGLGLVGDPYRNSSREAVIASLDTTMYGFPYNHGYSNLGFAVLTDIIIHVTGNSWLEYAATLLSRDFGIYTATLAPPFDAATKMSTFLRRDARPWSIGAGIYAGAGGLWTTLGDYFLFGRKVVSNWGGSQWRSWSTQGPLYFHSGRTRFSGSCIVVDLGRSVSVVAHTLGRRMGTADRTALELYKQFTLGDDLSSSP